MSGRFSSDVYARRISAAAAGATAAGLAGLIITPGYDLRYLIGSRAQTFERLTALVIPATGGQERSDPGLSLAECGTTNVIGNTGCASPPDAPVSPVRDRPETG